MFFDVSLYCKFPDSEAVLEEIEKVESRVVSLTSIAVLTPGNDTSIGLNVKQIDSAQAQQDIEKVLAETDGVLQHAISTFMRPHVDMCKGSSFGPAQNAEQIYNNIKLYLDRFDIYGKCTKTYVKRVPIQKDDVVAISTELAAGMFALSYEDVSQYKETVELRNGKPVKVLTMIISSRKENVIEGNYDVVVSVEGDEVVLQYTKRQNLAEKMLVKGITHNKYAIRTQRSVDSTLLKLAYAGLYGGDALSDEGCYGTPKSKCAEYGMFEKGEACQHDLQCESGKCVPEPACAGRFRLFAFNCDYVCL
jgi:hypothetical protein